MSGQGSVTNSIVIKLAASGWTVLFKCIPNTPHIGVVPIPIASGSAKQRYPDILSIKGTELRLSEVEIRLSDDVAEKAIERFAEQIQALSQPEVWKAWQKRVTALTGQQIPEIVTLRCELILCSKLTQKHADLIKKLETNCISVFHHESYLCE